MASLRGWLGLKRKQTDDPEDARQAEHERAEEQQRQMDAAHDDADKAKEIATKVRHIPEYDFAGDESGRELHALWEVYEDACYVTKLVYPAESDEVDAALNAFMNKFIQVFSYDKIDDLPEAAFRLVIHRDDTHIPNIEPESSRNCPGMPSKVVVELANLLLDSFGGYIPNKQAGVEGSPNAPAVLLGRSTQYLHVLRHRRGTSGQDDISTDSSSFKDKDSSGKDTSSDAKAELEVEAENSQTASPSSSFATAKFTRDRFHLKEGGYFATEESYEKLINLFRSVAIVVSWAHNRCILQRDLANQFPEVVIDWINYFCSESMKDPWTRDIYDIYDAGTGISTDGDASFDAPPPYVPPSGEDEPPSFEASSRSSTKPEKEIKIGDGDWKPNDMLLTTSTLTCLLQILGRCQAVSSVAEGFYCFNDFLPVHPWGTTALSSMGFRVFENARSVPSSSVFSYMQSKGENSPVKPMPAIIPEPTDESEAAEILKGDKELDNGLANESNANTKIPEQSSPRDSNGSSIDSDDIEIELDLGGIGDNFYSQEVAEQPKNNEFLHMFVSAGCINALVSMLNALSTVIVTIDFETKIACGLIKTLFILEAEVLHTLRMFLHYAPPALGIKEYYKWDVNASLGYLIQRRAVETKVDRMNKNSVWAEKDHVFFSHIHLRLGITCFAIVDSMNQILELQESDYGYPAPMSVERFSMFLRNLKKDFDFVARSSVPLYPAQGDMSRICLKTDCRTEFVAKTFADVEMWPWTTSTSPGPSEPEFDSVRSSTQAHNTTGSSSKTKLPVSGLHIPQLTVFAASPESMANFHIVSQIAPDGKSLSESGKSTGEQSRNTSPRAGSQVAQTPSNEQWDWATRGSGPAAWAYFFRAVYQTFCQEHHFKNIKKHASTFEFLLEAFSALETETPGVETTGGNGILGGTTADMSNPQSDDYSQNRFSDEIRGEMMELPLMQYHLLQFMSAIVKTDAVVTINVLSKSGFLLMLRGPMFLLDKVGVIDDSMATFTCSKTVDEIAQRVRHAYTHGTRPESLLCSAWLILQDIVLDFLLEHLKASFKLVNMLNGHADNTLVAVMLVLSAIVEPPVDDPHHNLMHPTDTLICASIKWLKYVLEAFPWSDEQYPVLFSRVTTCLFGLSGRQMYRHIGINGLVADRNFINFVFDESSSPFLFTSRVLIIELLMTLTQGSKSNWFLQLVKPEALDSEPIGTKYSHAKSGDQQMPSNAAYNGVTNENLYRTALLYLGDPNLVPKGVKGPGGAIVWEGQYSCPISTNELLLLFLDSRFKEPAMHLVFRIIYSSCVQISELEGADQGFLPSHQVNLDEILYYRHVIGAILTGVLDIVTSMATLPKRCDSFQTSLYALQSITWLLCNQCMSKYDYINKDCMFRIGAVQHLFFSLSNCAEGAALRKAEKDPNALLMPQIYKQTISLLSALMMQHEGNTQSFASKIRTSTDGLHKSSTEDFTSILREFEQVPSLELVVVLLEMLLSANLSPSVHRLVRSNGDPEKVMEEIAGANQSKKYKIVNPSVIPCIFSLLQFCEADTQLFAIQFFDFLTTGKSSLVNYNLNECSKCNPHLLDLCIDNILQLSDFHVQKVNVRLIQTLGRHKITVSHLKHLFKIMQSGFQSGHALRHHCRILDALREMITDVAGPKCKFVFGGQNSGLVLPHISKWPTTRGFSFCFWFKVESPTDILTLDNVESRRRSGGRRNSRNVKMPAKVSKPGLDSKSVHIPPVRASIYEPCILSMQSSDGSGIELSLQPVYSDSGKFKVILKSFAEAATISKMGKQLDPRGKETVFEYPANKQPLVATEGCWHFLAVSFTQGSAKDSSLFGRAVVPATIVLDDQAVTGHFPIPKLGGAGATLQTIIGDQCQYSRPKYGHGPFDSHSFDEEDEDEALREMAGDDNTPPSKESLASATDPKSKNNAEKNPAGTVSEKIFSYCGQMGAIYFFNTIVSTVQLLSIRELGSDYFYCFEPSTGSLQHIKNNPAVDQSIFHEHQGLMKSVMLAYNPSVVKGELFLDNTPEMNTPLAWKVVKPAALRIGKDKRESEDEEDMLMHAFRRSNTFSTSTQDVRKALDSLGGLGSLLPILLHADKRFHHQMKANLTNQYTISEMRKPLLLENGDADPESFASIDQDYNQTFSSLINLLGTLLRSDMKGMLKIMHGFAIISYFMDTMSPVNFTIDLMRNFIAIDEYLATAYNEGASELRNSLLKHILCNVHLWRYTPTLTQSTLFNWIIDFVTTDPKRARDVVSPIRWMDKIFTTYSYSTHSKEEYEYGFLMQCGCPENFLHEARVKGEETFERPKGWERVLLRSKLFHLLKLLLMKDPLPEDIAHLFGYLAVSSSPQAKIEYLQLLVELLNDIKVAPVVLLGMSYCEGMRYIISLGTHPNAKIRLYSVIIFCEVLYVGGLFQTFPKVPPGSKYYNSNSQERKPREELRANNVNGTDSYTTSSFPHKSTNFNKSYPNASIGPEAAVSDTTLERIGLAPSLLPELMHHFQASILAKIIKEHAEMTHLVGEIEANASASYQVGFITSAFLQACFGKSVNALSVFLKPRVFFKMSKENYTEIKKMELRRSSSLYANISASISSSSMSQAAYGMKEDYAIVEYQSCLSEETVSPRCDEKLDFSEPFPLTTNSVLDNKIIVSMPLVTLLTFINNKWTKLASQFDIIFQIKTVLFECEMNSDNLICLLGWHKCLFELLIATHANQADRNMSPGDKEISRCIEDLLTRIIFDLNLISLRIGHTNILPRISVHELNRQPPLDWYRLSSEFQSGSRIIGGFNIRETILFFHAMTLSYARQRKSHTSRHRMSLAGNVHAEAAASKANMIIIEAERHTNNMLNEFVLEVLDRLEEDDARFRTESVFLAAQSGKVSLMELQAIGINPERLANAQEGLQKTAYEFKAKVHLLNTWMLIMSCLDRMYEHPFCYPYSTNPEDAIHSELPHPIFHDAEKSENFTLGVDDSTKSSVGSVVSSKSPFINMWTLCTRFLHLLSLGVSVRSQPTEFPTVPYGDIAGGIYWCLLRFLCKTLLVANENDDSLLILQTAEKLISMLNYCIRSKYAFATFEELFVISTLSSMFSNLGSVTHSVAYAPIWLVFHEMLRRNKVVLLAMLLTANAPTLAREKCNGHRGDNPIPSQNATFLAEIKKILFFNDQGVADEYSRGQAVNSFNSRFAAETMPSLLNNNAKIRSGALDELKMEAWILVTKSLFEQGLMLHIFYARKCLEELGQPHLMAEVICKKVRIEGGHFSILGDMSYTLEEFVTTCNVSHDQFYDMQIIHLREWFRALSKQLKKDTIDSSVILSALMNERGPWGQFRYEEREVSWALDLADQCQMLLKPEVRASQHRIATQIQESGTSKVDTHEVITDDLQTQMKNLNKYQTKKTQKVTEKRLVDGKMVEGKKEEIDDLDSDDELIGQGDKAKNVALNIDVNPSAILFTAAVQVITYVNTGSSGVSSGTIELTSKFLAYKRANENKDYDDSVLNSRGNTEWVWATKLYPTSYFPIEDLKLITSRYYQMQPIGMELFFFNRKSLFLAFENAVLPKKLSRKLLSLGKIACPHLSWEFYGTGPSIANRPMLSLLGDKPKTLTEAWKSRELTNYEYLMKLNFIAGRSFNDLSQYPVFPWVIADYTSNALDLKNPKTFRDFRYPAGAQNPKTRSEMQAHFEQIEEMNIESVAATGEDCGMSPSHSGSHYSISGNIYGFMIRNEPFTSLHVSLQAGKFDKPDRLFHSITEVWESVSGENRMDCRELIPEFFTNPDFLRNPNGIILGKRQDGKVLGNVYLPPWASNRYDFIEKHKDALESEHVSKNLHHWIDLIFGYKQRPPFLDGGSQAAVEACNVFPKNSYQGAFNMEQLKLENPAQYNVFTKIVAEYGQTPQQLFREPHPERNPLIGLDRKTYELITQDIIWPIASSVPGFATINFQLPKDSNSVLQRKYNDLKYDKPQFIQCFEDFHVSTSPVLFISEIERSEVLITIDEQRVLGLHSFIKRAKDHIPPYVWKLDLLALRLSQGLHKDATMSDMVKTAMGVSHARIDRRVGVAFGTWGLASSHSSSVEGTGEIAVSKASKRNGKKNQEIVAGDKYAVLLEERDRSEVAASRKLAEMKRKESKQTESSGRERSDSIRSHARVSTVQSQRKVGDTSPSRSERTVRTRKESDTSSAQPSSSAQSGASSISVGSSSVTIQSSPVTSTKRSDATREFVQASLNAHATPPTSRASRVSQASSSSSGDRSGDRSKSYQSAEPSHNAKNTTTKSPLWERERENDHLGSHLFACLPGSKLLFTCGHWDNSFRVTNTDTCKLLQTVGCHQEVVTCLAIASDVTRHWLLTGSEDSTVCVWEIRPDMLDKPINPVPLHQLHGHDNTVNCIAVNSELDIIVSGSEDGTMMIHSLREGTYIRTISLNVLSSSKGASSKSAKSAAAAAVESRKPKLISKNDSGRASGRINMIAISREGYIVAYSTQGHILSTFPLNSIEIGGPIRRIVTGERLYCMTISEDGKVLMTGGAKCLVILRWVFSLGLANDGAREGLEAVIDGRSERRDGEPLPPFKSPIRSLYMTSKEAHLLVGLESGHMRILAQESEYLRQRLHKRLEVTGFLK